MSKKMSANFALRSSAVNKKMRFMLLSALLGSLIGAVVVFIALDMQRTPGEEIASLYHPATYAIAEKFMCGCPECELELAKCQCDHVKGGKNELAFISEKLKQGHSETEVVNEVYEQFGNIKD